MSELVLKQHGVWDVVTLTAQPAETWDLHDGLGANLSLTTDTTVTLQNVRNGVPLWLRVTGDDTSVLTVANAQTLSGVAFSWTGGAAIIVLRVQDATTIYAAVVEEVVDKGIVVTKAGHGLSQGQAVDYATDLSDVVATNATLNTYNGVVSEVIDASNVRIAAFGQSFTWVGHGLSTHPFFYLGATDNTWAETAVGPTPVIGLYQVKPNTFCAVGIPGGDGHDAVTIAPASTGSHVLLAAQELTVNKITTDDLQVGELAVTTGLAVGSPVTRAGALTDANSNNFFAIVKDASTIKVANTGPMTWTGHGLSLAEQYYYLGTGGTGAAAYSATSVGTNPIIALSVIDANTVVPITTPK